MYYIRMDYLEALQGDKAHIEFKRKFKPNSLEMECYAIFTSTGFLPTYCP